MSEQGPDFDARREAYEKARAERDRIIDSRDPNRTPDQYRAAIKDAQHNVNTTHQAMLGAWT